MMIDQQNLTQHFVLASRELFLSSLTPSLPLYLTVSLSDWLTCLSSVSLPLIYYLAATEVGCSTVPNLYLVDARAVD